MRGAAALVQASGWGCLGLAAALGVGQRQVLGLQAQIGVKAPGFADEESTEKEKWRK